MTGDGALDISSARLALGYLLLLIPLGIALWYRVPLAADTVTAVLRMTVQLLFVGFYLQVVFALDLWWVTALWLVAMTIVADLSVVRGAGLRLRRFATEVFFALLVGTALPLAYFLVAVLNLARPWEPQYAIPIAGMIMGNCLRANIIGIGQFFGSIRRDEKTYLLALGQGASRSEAILPYLRDALRAAFAPTVATMATIGLVSLPGMMTGIILGGTGPMTAIKYQIAIMIAIFVGTAVTVHLGILMAQRRAFDAYGILDEGVFRQS